MTRPVVLILGATGLFGGFLARRLIDEGRFDVVCSGRNQTRLDNFCHAHGGRAYALDRQDDETVARAFEALKPFAVVDCAGPYQAYGDEPYRFAKLAISTGCHYFDIADDSDYVKGFGELDALAKKHDVVALSGSSSTPAVSSSVADHLTKDFSHVISITTVILPGNRTKRTLSVMRSILSQIGQPMMLTRHGKRERVLGWGETESFDLAVKGKKMLRDRLASFVDTPDIAFFTERYQAETVIFKAGLELKFFQYALVFGRLLVSCGLVKTLEPFTNILRWLASWFEALGSDEGGMKVSVLGQKSDGTYERRVWDLIADGGHGPNIPTLPVSILLNKTLNGEVSVGARACLGEITLEELDIAMDVFGAKTEVHTQPVQPIFQQALGKSYDALPHSIKALHSQLGMHVYEGIASVKGPTGLLGRIASRLVGFPTGNGEMPVKVTIASDDRQELWVREFDGQPFSSNLSLDQDGFMQERFGPLSIRLGLEVHDKKLFYPVVRGRLFGCIPFPTFLMPQSVSHEEVDEEGRFVFDVLLKFRFGGRIAHYQGWLVKSG